MILSKLTKSHYNTGVYTFLIALLLVGFSFILQGDIGFNLASEGYLWYGTIRTAAGDIPMLDFRSKDPGRYYWTAGLSFIFGDGIMDLRLSIALFQVIGLTLGLLAARRVVKNWWILGLVGLLLVVWMYPRHKLFEPSLAMAAVYTAVCLIEKPVFKRYFFSGVFVGVAAFMGRNHGLYNFLAFFVLILFIWIKFKEGSLLKQYGSWLGGIIVGYMPMLILLGFIPGMFWLFFYDQVLPYFKTGFTKTNFPLPVPFPWTVETAQLDLLTSASKFALGLFFSLLPIFYILVIIWSLMRSSSDVRSNSLLIAASFVGFFYMNHAFSRAGPAHLATSIHPFLLGFVALLHTLKLRHHKSLVICLAVLVFTGTIFAIIIPRNPLIQSLRFKDEYIPYDIAGDRLWLPKGDAYYIENIQQLVAQHVGPDEGLFIAPHSPGLYVILQREAPVYDSYILGRYSKKAQETLIQDLTKNKVNWAILADVAMDGLDELRFRNAHPLVWQYLTTNFEPIETSKLPSNQQFLRRKEPLK